MSSLAVVSAACLIPCHPPTPLDDTLPTIVLPIFAIPCPPPDAAEETVEVRCAAVYALGCLYSRAPDSGYPGTGDGKVIPPDSLSSAQAGGRPRRPGEAYDSLAQHANGRSFMDRPPGMGSAVGQGLPLGRGVGGDGLDGGVPGLGGGGGHRGSLVMSNMGMPALVPDLAGAGTVAGTSETRRLDELGIAFRLARYYRDPR